MKSLNIENLQAEWLSSFKDCVFDWGIFHSYFGTDSKYTFKKICFMGFFKAG